MSDFQSEGKISRLIEEALLEDIGMGDVTTEATVDSHALGRGHVLVKEAGVIAGLEIAEILFQILDREVMFKTTAHDGMWIEPGTVVAHLEGSLAVMLKGERTALNILQRMSGIASLTKKFVDAVKGTKAKIIDTRKTAPGLRLLDKMAVKIGGGDNHRFGLDDMVLIKDNHITAAGGIDAAIDACVKYLSGKSYKLDIEVETKNLDEVRQVLRHKGIRRIMLDNFTTAQMNEAVRVIDHAVEVEASGNVSLQNVREIAEAGVDCISIGMLTHSPKALDISLKIVSAPHQHSS